MNCSDEQTPAWREQELVSTIEKLTALTDDQAATIELLKSEGQKQDSQISFLNQQIAETRQKLQAANAQLSGSSAQLRQSEQRREEAEKQLSKIAWREERLRKNARHLNMYKKQLTGTLNDKVREAKAELEWRRRLYEPYLFTILLYAVLVTFFAGIYLPGIQQSAAAAASILGEFLSTLSGWILQAGGAAASLGDLIPHEATAAVVHWTFQIAVVGGLWAGVGYVIWRWGCLFRNAWGKALARTACCGVAIITFFAAQIEQILPVNAVLLFCICLTCGAGIIAHRKDLYG